MSAQKARISACALQRQIGCSLKTAGRVLLRIYSPGPDRSAFSVLAADTHEVDDFYIGAKAPGKSGRGTKQQPMLNSGRQGSCPLRCAEGVLERLLAPGGA